MFKISISCHILHKWLVGKITSAETDLNLLNWADDVNGSK